MTSHTADHAWDLGYHYAVRGIQNAPMGTWLTAFMADWSAGYQQAIRDGKWGTY